MARAPKTSDVLKILQSRLDGIQALLADVDPSAGDKLIQMIRRARRVFVTGKGRSGFVGQCLATRLMQLGLDVHVPGEATCPRIGRGDLMIAISCSGTTTTTVQLARISRRSGAKVAAVTAMCKSPLARLATHVIVLPVMAHEVRKRFRYVTGPYNNTLFEEALLLYLDAMVFAILEREHIPKRTLRQRHTNLE